jgi:hypothetical protein
MHAHDQPASFSSPDGPIVHTGQPELARCDHGELAGCDRRRGAFSAAVAVDKVANLLLRHQFG